MATEYKIFDGTSYDIRTPDEVCGVLEFARKTAKRVRMFYGDVKTGKSWMDEYDICGTIGRSSGDVKVPLLLQTTRSTGGMQLLDHCIVALFVDGRLAYRNKMFKFPVFEIKDPTPDLKSKGFTVMVFCDGNNVSNFKTITSASNWMKFMRGERMAK